MTNTKTLIIKITLNGSGIRNISRVLKISPNTVLSAIRQKSAIISQPKVPAGIRNVKIDEFWSFVEKKKS